MTKTKAARNPEHDVNIELVPIVSQAITSGMIPLQIAKKAADLVEKDGPFEFPPNLGNFFKRVCDDYPRSLKSVPGWANIVPDKILDGKIISAETFIQTDDIILARPGRGILTGLVFVETPDMEQGDGAVLIHNNNRSDFRILAFGPDLMITPKVGEFICFPSWQKYIVTVPKNRAPRKIIRFEYDIFGTSMRVM